MHQFSFLDKVESKFYIEAGANDGLTQNNTYELEQMGWKGLLVEPCPTNYTKCLRARGRNNYVENYALVGDSYEGDTIGIFVEPRCYNGLMAVVNHFPDGMVDPERIPHHEDFVQKFKLPETQIPAITIQRLLDKHSINEVGYFSLDVEGYELEVLTGLNFDKVRPEFFRLEVTQNESHRERVRTFMSDRNYELVEMLTDNDALYKDK